MKPKSKKIAIALFSVATTLFACQKQSVNSGTNSGPTGVQIFLTDHATPIFDSVFIDIKQLEVKLEGDTLSNGGWVNVSIHPGIYNILRLRNGLDTLFATGTLPNANITKLRLSLGTQNSAVKAGQVFPLKIDNNDKVIEVNMDASNFEITTSGQMLFWIDFDAGNSIQIDNSGSGINNGFRLKAHLNMFTKHKSATVEGTVLPKAANAIVKAINGADTTTAIPEDSNGEFKIMGLKAGIYKILYDGTNGYLDTTVNNIQVQNNVELKLATITLHK